MVPALKEKHYKRWKDNSIYLDGGSVRVIGEISAQ